MKNDQYLALAHTRDVCVLKGDAVLNVGLVCLCTYSLDNGRLKAVRILSEMVHTNVSSQLTFLSG